MIRIFRTPLIRSFFKKKRQEIFPDEILLDSSFLASSQNSYNASVERPMGISTLRGLRVIVSVVVCVYLFQVFRLQVVDGEEYVSKSSNNRVDSERIWAERGVIVDRNGKELAWNALPSTADQTTLYEREYTDLKGLSHILGFVRYPKLDKNGYYYEDSLRGVSGVESVYNDTLTGLNGERINETSVYGSSVSQNLVRDAQQGKKLTLTIDAELQSALYTAIENLSLKAGFEGGGGVILDSYTGEILAVTSYPEFDRKKLLEGDEGPVYLNRATQGLYTPGSIVKPFIALAGLAEGNITPETKVLSARTIKIPNPYNPSNPTIFHDWKGFGMLNVRDALSNSPNSFFFATGGGYGGVKGVGISKIEEYMNAFGIGKDVAIDGFISAPSVVPNPGWKAKHFDGDDWRLGDTFLTSIGQYGFQVTPLHMARAIAAIANDGLLINPTLSTDQTVAPEKVSKNIPLSAYQVVREGMAGTITAGTAKTLNIKDVSVSAKTGTAEIGKGKAFVNSWVVGFFPNNTRRYTFAVVMEKAPRANMWGATWVMRDTFIWMKEQRPLYLGLPAKVIADEDVTSREASISSEPLIR